MHPLYRVLNVSAQYMIRLCCCHVLSLWLGKLGLMFGISGLLGTPLLYDQLQLFVLLSVLLSLFNIVLL